MGNQIEMARSKWPKHGRCCQIVQMPSPAGPKPGQVNRKAGLRKALFPRM